MRGRPQQAEAVVVELLSLKPNGQWSLSLLTESVSVNSEQPETRTSASRS